MTTQFAIKYRPKSLDDVIGQDFTVQILKNAISKNKLGNAIIFTGIRGTGKTSLARIIAKTINCEENSIIPCEKCKSCLAIQNNNDLDIIEIDAASNTGVDDIRTIIESCQYKPLISKYKVYIIDEVHMLSKSAFNAILKTLEEPPSHVKFIFATTEINKVPDTILSRCLNFDLKRISEDDLFNTLKKISQNEQINIEDNAIKLISKKAEGSLRDSLSLLNLVANLEEPITEHKINSFLSIIDASRLIRFIHQMIFGNLNNAIMDFREIAKNISSYKDFFLSLLEIVHVILCRKLEITPVNNNFLNESDNELLNEIAEKSSVFSLNNIWQIIVRGIDEITFMPNQQISAEIIIIRICYTLNIPDVSDILKRSVTSEKEVLELPKISLINAQKSEKTEIVQKFSENHDEQKKLDNNEKSPQKISTANDVLKMIENDSILYGYIKSSTEIEKIQDNTIFIDETEFIPGNVKSKFEKIFKEYKIIWKPKEIFTQELINEAKSLFAIQDEENV